jgi:hypothetical protein
MSQTGAILAGLFSGGKQGYLEHGAAIPVNRWTHIAVTWDGQQVRSYLDGEPQDAVPFTGPLTKIPGPLRIGKGDTIVSYAFVGLLDEVSFYGRALSAAEIAAIAKAGSAGKCKP